MLVAATATAPMPAPAAPPPALAGLANRCIAGDTGACQAALGPTHTLKQRAEQQNKLSCYTQILGLESHLIMQSIDGNNGPATAAALQETSRSCGW